MEKHRQGNISQVGGKRKIGSTCGQYYNLKNMVTGKIGNFDLKCLLFKIMI
jgi:hypothetical protein